MNASSGVLAGTSWGLHAEYTAVEGEGRWRDEEGEYAYIQLTIDDVQYNVP
jgi:hypothetical protein